MVRDISASRYNSAKRYMKQAIYLSSDKSFLKGDTSAGRYIV